MPKDPIQDIARLVVEVVKVHGVQTLLFELPIDVQVKIYRCLKETYSDTDAS